ncbi:MAG: TetR/AcrR family transcriptional regulator [Myxococcota bacterium]
MPSSDPRSTRVNAKAAETRLRLVEAAVGEFADKGFGGASTRGIASRAGVALASLPYHFKTKEALWKAAADHLFGIFREQFVRRIEGLDGVDALTRSRLLLRDFVVFSAAHPELHRFLLQDGSERTARLEWLVAEHVRPMFSLTRELADELASTGYPAPMDAEQRFYAMIGAAATVFAASAQVELVTGEDPFAKERIEAHADAIVALFYPAPSERSSAVNPR